MKDMTKEEFRKLVVFTVKEAHPGWEKSVEEILKAVDAVLLDTIETGPAYNGIRITDALRISIKRVKAKMYRDVRDGEKKMSTSKYVARLRDSEMLRGALAKRA